MAQDTEYAWGVEPSAEGPFSTNHSGARDISGPHDLDGDGKWEVLVADYTGGGRVHVFENASADTWELIWSSPALDATGTTNNMRTLTGGDLDGDGLGEVIFLSGNNFATDNPLAGIGMFLFEATGDNTFNETVVKYDFATDPPDRWRAEQMTARDLDGDGRDEVFFGNNGSANAYDSWYIIGVLGDIGSGFETFVEEVRLSSRASQDFDPVNRGGGSPYGMVAGDLDGDGSMEVSMMAWNNYTFTNLRVAGADTYTIPGATDANVFLQASPTDDVAFFGCYAYDINKDGDDEVFCPNLQSGAVSVLNYESGENALEVTADNVSFNMIPGLADLGLTVGDFDQDGMPDIIGNGPSYRASDFAAGLPPRWIKHSEFLGGDVEDPANYSATSTIEFGSAMNVFSTVMRDSSGVQTTYYESGAQGNEFVSKMAFLGDADGDGFNELAASMQGVDDSLYTYSEVFNPADSTYSRTTISAVANDRVFFRVFTTNGVKVNVEDTRFVLPEDYVLEQNYPNPFNPTTSIRFTLPIDKAVSVRVYDVQGRLVRTLMDNQFTSQGTHQVTWDGTNDAGAQAASGSYLYTLEYGNFRQAKTMVLLK